VQVGLIDIGDVEHLPGGNQAQALELLLFVWSKLQLPDRLAVVQMGLGLAEDLGPGGRVLVATAGGALGLVERSENGFQVGQDQFGIDGVDIADGID
jgi:hypothetical protein